MKYSKFLFVLGFFALLGSSCSHSTSCPAYSDNNTDVETETTLDIEESNV